jgi:cob(I)alamin adenosyltransferase
MTEKKKTFAQRIGIIKSDVDDDVKQNKAEVKAEVINPVSVPSSFLNQSTTSGVPDEKFVQMLMKVIADNNIPGLDYFEFKQAIDAMTAAQIDEKTKFMTTFIVYAQQGCKKEVLLSSIDKYMSVIKNEVIQFDSELRTQREEKVRSKLSQVEEAKKKVADLTQAIADANNFILKASQEAQQENLNLQIVEANFKKSAERVLGMLQGDKEKINNYIQ